MHVDETPVDDVRVVFRQGLRSAGASATRARIRPPGRIMSSVARHASLRSPGRLLYAALFGYRRIRCAAVERRGFGSQKAACTVAILSQGTSWVVAVTRQVHS